MENNNTRGTDSQLDAGAAVSANGTVYHNVAEIYHQAEECESLHMWLDDKGVPRADAEGRVFSPVGRVMGIVQDAARFRWLNEDHADADVRWAAHMLAKRLGTSSYFAITRDIDAEMGAGSAREGGNTNAESGSDIATTTSTVSAPNEQAETLATLLVTSTGISVAHTDAAKNLAHGYYLLRIAAPSGTEGAQKAPEELRNQALATARDALNSLLWQFTAAPSTFKDSNARAQGHAAIKAIDEALRTSSTDQAIRALKTGGE